ncbi:MAG: S-layer homology domain-containing protein [Bacillota bacterium]
MYKSPVSDFAITPSRGYSAQKQWINVGGVFDMDNDHFDDDAPVALYLSDTPDGDTDSAVGDVLATTKGAFLAEAGAENGVITARKYTRGIGLMTDHLEAGTYYVTLKAGDGEDAVFLTQPYTVFDSVRAYGKAALDDLIAYYIEKPEVSGSEVPPEEVIAHLTGLPNPMLAQMTKRNLVDPLQNEGYRFYDSAAAESPFWKTYQPNYYSPLYMEPYYTGLYNYDTTGTDWEAWIFTALGKWYPYERNGNVNSTDFSGESELLRGKPLLRPDPGSIQDWLQSEESRGWLDNRAEVMQIKGVTSTKTLRESIGQPYAKHVFRYIAALMGMGADPRSPYPGEEYNANYVDAALCNLYVADTIQWDDEGSPDFSEAKIPEDGYPMNVDPLYFSYLLLALEMANAAPAEGYTEEARDTLLEAVITTVEGHLENFLQDSSSGETGGDIGGGYAGAFAVDTCAMASLPLCFAADHPVYGERIRHIFEVMPAAFGGIVDIQGGGENEDFYGANSNSVAMAVNALIAAGYTAADLEDDLYQGTYQTLLSSLVNCQMANGAVAYAENDVFMGRGNQMSTYQTLGALVDLYNGKSCFVIHSENYLERCPQYSDEGHAFTALMAGLPADAAKLNWEETANVKAARNLYTALYHEQNPTGKAALKSYFEDELALLAELEANCGKAVGRELSGLPEKDLIQISDGPYLRNLAAVYEALSAEQKEEANGEKNENLHKLRSALAALTERTAKNVGDFLLTLPDADDVSERDRADIEAGRAAYEKLSDDQKSLVDAAALKKLRDAERALTHLAANNVSKAIEALPEAEEVRLSYRGVIEDVRAAYDALSEEERAQITNGTKLRLAEAVLAELIAALNAPAEEVSAMIAALPDAADITAGDRTAVEAARKAFDALSEELKALVSNAERLIAAEAACAEVLAGEDQAKAAAVIALIDAIGDVTADSKDAIGAARAAFDCLTDFQQTLVTNIDVLEVAETAYEALPNPSDDQAKADEVIALIDAIGDVTADSKEAIEAARSVYDALTDTQKALVTNADTLEQAEKAFADLADQAKADEVIALIDAIGDVTADSKDDIDAARSAYDALTDAQKALVTNADTLEQAEKAFADLADQAKADEVIALIDAIGEVTADSKDDIEAARSAFDALTDAQQELVTNADTLEQAEKAYEALTQQGDDRAKADAVTELIRAIGDVDASAECKERIDAARAAYDALTDAQKELVTNAAALTAAEEAYAALTAPLPFIDIANHWGKDAILYAHRHQLVDGIGENRFAPDMEITRGMVVTILYRQEGEPAVSGSCAFNDVAEGRYYYDAVIWAQNSGVVKGMSPTVFAPEENITREQLATMIHRYAGYKGIDVSGRSGLADFRDASLISGWAKEAMSWANDAGLILGRSRTELAPRGTATRAEFVTVLMRYLETVAKK